VFWVIFLSRAHVNHAPVASAFLNALLSLSSIRPPTGGSGSSPVAALEVGPPFTEAIVDESRNDLKIELQKSTPCPVPHDIAVRFFLLL
jgi:hypothetical protein